MEKPDALEIERSQILLIDMQQRILPQIRGANGVASRCRTLVQAAGELGVPVSFSEHYPQGLGPTEPDLLDALNRSDAVRLEKITFSAWREPSVAQRVRSLDRPQVVVAGIETHVCVQQTVLDMLRDGLTPVVLTDAVGSRYAVDHEAGLERMRQAGACVTTVESVLFEWLERAGTDRFRALLPLLRQPRADD